MAHTCLMCGNACWNEGDWQASTLSGYVDFIVARARNTLKNNALGGLCGHCAARILREAARRVETGRLDCREPIS